MDSFVFFWLMFYAICILAMVLCDNQEIFQRMLTWWRFNYWSWQGRRIDKKYFNDVDIEKYDCCKPKKI